MEYFHYHDSFQTPLAVTLKQKIMCSDQLLEKITKLENELNNFKIQHENVLLENLKIKEQLHNCQFQLSIERKSRELYSEQAQELFYKNLRENNFDNIQIKRNIPIQRKKQLKLEKKCKESINVADQITKELSQATQQKKYKMQKESDLDFQEQQDCKRFLVQSQRKQKSVCKKVKKEHIFQDQTSNL